MHAPSSLTTGLVHASASRIHHGERSFFEVRASGFVHALPEQAWQVLTDYGRLADFVPDLLSSRLLSRNGFEAIVEQRSEVGLLFATHTIHMVERIAEQPFSTIEVALVSGDMKHYKACWDLAPSMQNGASGTRITYTGAMVPDFFIPPVLGESVVQANMKKMVEAVIAEIERRH